MTFTAEQKDKVLQGFINGTNTVVTRIRGDDKQLWKEIDDPNWNWAVNEYRLLAYVSALPVTFDATYVYIKDGIFYWWNGYKVIQASTGKEYSFYLAGFDASAMADSFLWPSTTHSTATEGVPLTAQISYGNNNNNATIVYSKRNNKLDVVINGKNFQQDGKYEVIDSGGNQNIDGEMGFCKIPNGYVLSVKDTGIDAIGDLSVTGSIDAQTVKAADKVETESIEATSATFNSLTTNGTLNASSIASSTRITQDGATVVDTKGGQKINGDLEISGMLKASRVQSDAVESTKLRIDLSTNVNTAFTVPSEVNTGVIKNYYIQSTASNLPTSVSNTSVSGLNFTTYFSSGAYLETKSFLIKSGSTYKVMIHQKIESALLSSTVYRTVLVRSGTISGSSISSVSSGTPSWTGWCTLA